MAVTPAALPWRCFCSSRARHSNKDTSHHAHTAGSLISAPQHPSLSARIMCLMHPSLGVCVCVQCVCAFVCVCVYWILLRVRLRMCMRVCLSALVCCGKHCPRHKYPLVIAELEECEVAVAGKHFAQEACPRAD